MATRTSSSRNYYIRPDALSFLENYDGDARKFSVSVDKDATVKVYYPDISFFEIQSDGSYKQFRISASNTYIGTTNYGSDLYLYLRVDDTEPDTAVLVFSKNDTETYKVEGVEKKDSTGTIIKTSYYVNIGKATFTSGTYRDSYEIKWDSGMFDTDEYWSSIDKLGEAFGLEEIEIEEEGEEKGEGEENTEANIDTQAETSNDAEDTGKAGNEEDNPGEEKQKETIIVPKKRFKMIDVKGYFSADSLKEESVMKLPNGSRMEVPDKDGKVISGFGNKEDFFIWAGAEKPEEAVFSVSKNGKVMAMEAEITGNITAESAVFSGFVQNNFSIVSSVYTMNDNQEFILDGKHSHLRIFRGTTCVLPIGKQYIGRRILLYDVESAGGMIETKPNISAGSPDYCAVRCTDNYEIFGYEPYDIHLKSTVRSIFFKGGFIELIAVPYSKANSCRWVVVANTATWRGSDASVSTLESSQRLLYYGKIEWNGTAPVIATSYCATDFDLITIERTEKGMYTIEVGNLVDMSGTSTSIDVTTQCMINIFGYGRETNETDGLMYPIVATVRYMELNKVYVDTTCKGELTDGSFFFRIELLQGGM